MSGNVFPTPTLQWGALLQDPTTAMQVATKEYVDTRTGSTLSEAPGDGQIYGRNGAATSWVPVEPATSTVSSFNTRTGAVTLTLPDITGAGGAPNANPSFTGTVNASNLQVSGSVGGAGFTALLSPYALANSVLPVSGGTMSGPLLYTATGGTTARAAQDRAGQVIDIRDLGALCNGVTDDTAAWTAAMAKPNGTVIRIPQNCVSMVGDGAFLAGGGRAVSIIGDGRGSIIRLIAGTSLANDLFSWTAGPVALRIENLTIDLNNCPVPAALRQILVVSQATSLVIRNVRIINAPANMYLIALLNVTDWLVDSCYMNVPSPSQTAQSKGLVTESSLGPSTNGRVTNNVMVGTNTNFAGASQLYFAGNDISGWGVGAGIATDQSAAGHNTIIGNKFHDSMTGLDMYGIAPNGVENWSNWTLVSSNLCWNCCGSGIDSGGNNCLIVGNECWDNNTFLATGAASGAGISLSTTSPAMSANTAVMGNVCWDSGVNRQLYGFKINNSGIVNIKLSANDFSGATADVSLANATFRANYDYVPRNPLAGLNVTGASSFAGAATITGLLTANPASGDAIHATVPASANGVTVLGSPTWGFVSQVSSSAVSGHRPFIYYDTAFSVSRVILSANGNLQLGASAAGDNGLSIFLQGTGFAPQIQAQGVDTNINLRLVPKGTGFVQAGGGFQQSTTGPTWTSGAGAPSSNQPVGSIYSNTSGAAGARLYVSAGGGTWTAVAGV